VRVSRSKIFHTYIQATKQEHQEGLLWYENAHRICLEISGLASKPLESVVGVLAALSPSVSWERNVEEARAMLLGDHTVRYSTYPPNVDKAWRITEGEPPEVVLGGNKVRSFYSLILHPQDGHTVCIDRHAVKVATRREWKSDKEASQFLRTGYDRCAEAYRQVARQLRLLPHQVQAITWLVQRRNGNGLGMQS